MSGSLAYWRFFHTGIIKILNFDFADFTCGLIRKKSIYGVQSKDFGKSHLIDAACCIEDAIKCLQLISKNQKDYRSIEELDLLEYP